MSMEDLFYSVFFNSLFGDLKFLLWRSFLSFLRFIFSYFILRYGAIMSVIIFPISFSEISLLI